MFAFPVFLSANSVDLPDMGYYDHNAEQGQIRCSESWRLWLKKCGMWKSDGRLR
jgi:hypothetical protein